MLCSRKALTQPHVPQAGACTSANEQSFPLAELPTDALTCVLSKLPVGQLLAASTVRSSTLLSSPGARLHILHFCSCALARGWLQPASQKFAVSDLLPYLQPLRCVMALQVRGVASAWDFPAKTSGRLSAGQQAASERERGGVSGHLQRQQVGCAAEAARHRGSCKALSVALAVQARKLLRDGGGVFHPLSNAASLSSWGPAAWAGGMSCSL